VLVVNKGFKTSLRCIATRPKWSEFIRDAAVHPTHIHRLYYRVANEFAATGNESTEDGDTLHQYTAFATD